MLTTQPPTTLPRRWLRRTRSAGPTRRPTTTTGRHPSRRPTPPPTGPARSGLAACCTGWTRTTSTPASPPRPRSVPLPHFDSINLLYIAVLFVRSSSVWCWCAVRLTCPPNSRYRCAGASSNSRVFNFFLIILATTSCAVRLGRNTPSISSYASSQVVLFTGSICLFILSFRVAAAMH